ncbi:MAG: PT repeat-containing protein [uncultured bacterium]|nr:MAG: PT repeat-containing protein [uncultured bacterium]
MNRKQIGLIVLVAAIIAGGIVFFTKDKKASSVKQIQVNGVKESSTPANSGDVNPITGLACENWNRRNFSVMQPADVDARPLAGLSESDMTFEMVAVYGGITRLMGVYGCNYPEEVGSLRSARHDFVHLAKSLDSIYVHWGRADIEQFKDVLNSGIIDDMNCNNDAGKSAGQYCFRKTREGNMRGVDTGYAKFADLLKGAENYGYSKENKFVGYPHQAEASIDQRPSGGNLRVAFAKPYDVEYDYDKASNSYLRTWGSVADTDRSNKKRIAPKNVVVMIADAAPIKVGEQYANVQIGDPWYDQADSGSAFFYMNGQQYKGTWRKDRNKIDSKLFFLDEQGQEIKFVPGQIWVDIIDPGQALRWTPAA